MLAKSFSGRVVFFHVLDLNPSYTIAYAHELGVSVPVYRPRPRSLSLVGSFPVWFAPRECRVGKVY